MMNEYPKDILFDIDMQLYIASTISYQDVPTVEINKSYVPRKIFE